MNEPLQIGIIGLGYWGPNLVRNFRAVEGATVSICCDLDLSRFQKLAAQYGDLDFTTSAKEIIENPGIDAVVIATPVLTHFELARMALNAGKSVLVEKPLSLRVEDAEELVELADRKGLTLQVDHVFVYSPAVKQIKQIVDSGRLGRLFFIDSVRINLGLFQRDANVIWDLAPHDLSIVDYLVERMPRSVSAFGSVHADKEMEDVAYLNLDFGDGLIANFHVNWLSPVKVRSMIIGGSDQSLIYNDLDASEGIKIYDRGIRTHNDEERHRSLISYRTGDMSSPNVSRDEPLGIMATDFVRCIQQKRRPVADGESGLRVVKILEAAQRSIKAQGGRIVL
jgi:predicted dehydrogenase